ncbi:MrsA [Haemophilus influenzae 22.1-21]|nr:MrsA [Haemophilus influenzae 22.1-21]
MVNRKYFGTDGVRGKVGAYPITPDFALKIRLGCGKSISFPRFENGFNR